MVSIDTAIIIDPSHASVLIVHKLVARFSLREYEFVCISNREFNGQSGRRFIVLIYVGFN